MESQSVSSSDETFFNGTVPDSQIPNETETDEIVNTTVINLSQGSKTPRQKKNPPVAEPKPRKSRKNNANKENELPKNVAEKKLTRTSETKRGILKVLSENAPAEVNKPKPSPKKVPIKLPSPPRRTKTSEKDISSMPKIVISSREKRSKEKPEESKSSDGGTPGEMKKGCVNDVRNLGCDKGGEKRVDKGEKSPSRERGRLSKIDPETKDLLVKLESVFPNVDPDYLKCQFLKFRGSLSETIDYVIVKEKRDELPTKADYLRRQEMERQQKEYLDNFSVEDFLKMFPDPWEYFLKQERGSSVKYADHSVHYLKSKFRKHYTQAIQAALVKNNYSLYRASKELQKKNRLMKMRATNRSKGECDNGRPTTYNEQFMHEMAFIENEGKIKAHIKKAETAKHKKFTQAKKAGTLLECLSCNDPALLLDDAVNCPANHVFCKDCVVKSVKVKMENNNFRFKCVVKCEEVFSMESLQRILTHELMEKIQARNQLEELKAAQIEDLVWCPFCFYATIMPPELSVFNCLNPDCMKESCRRCKQLNHIPLKCHELEKFDKSVSKEQNAEADEKEPEELKEPHHPLTCIECNQDFLEIDESNKLVCPCGRTICSICRQPTSECPHWKDMPADDEPKEVLSVSDANDTSDDDKDGLGSEGFDMDGNLADFYPERFHSL